MPSGGARVNAGRRMTDLRSLNISDVGVAFDEPVEYCAEGLTSNLEYGKIKTGKARGWAGRRKEE